MSIRVTIFEDNIALNRALKQMLSDADEIELADAFFNCNNVLHDIAKSNPDVVLMDINMPGINGIEAVKIIRKQFPKLRILMQTVFDDDDNIFESIVAGASGYILKKNLSRVMIDAIVEVYNGGAPMSPAIASRVLSLFQNHVSKNEETQNQDYNISNREKDILRCMIDGKPYKQICDELNISYNTVRTHVKKIYEKLHVSSNTEAVSKAIRQKLI